MDKNIQQLIERTFVSMPVTALGEKIQIILNGDYSCYLLCADMHNHTLSSR